MKKVEFLKLQNDGSQAVVATCYMEGETVKCEGSQALVDSLNNEGIRSAVNPDKTLFPADGEQFLNELPNVFTSAYLLARMVEG